MWLRRTAGSLLVALSLAACADSQPTTVGELAPGASAEAKKPDKAPKAQARAELLTQMEVTGTLSNGAPFTGLLTVTEFGLNQASRQLTVDAVLTYTANGRVVAQVLDNVPATLGQSAGAVASAPRGAGYMGSSGLASTTLGTMMMFQAQEAGACDILFLEIPGGVFLDVLGLTVDLAPVELDLDAVSGQGRLLGNLLCAVTGLLDGVGSIGGLLNLLDRINDILDDLLGSIGGLLNDIPVAGALPGGGTFTGLLDITGFAFENGQLLVSGVLQGTATGVPITQTFQNLPVTLSEALGGGGTAHRGAAHGGSMPLASTQLVPAFLASMMMQAQELGACDILFLEIPGGVFLDVLGLTVDLAPVELDVDAVSGANALLGNLLCALTGLLGLITSLPALIGQIGDLIDLINSIIDLIDQF